MPEDDMPVKLMIDDAPPLVAEDIDTPPAVTPVPLTAGVRIPEPAGPPLADVAPGRAVQYPPLNQSQQAVMRARITAIRDARQDRANAHLALLEAVGDLPVSSRRGKAALLATEANIDRTEAVRLVGLAGRKLLKRRDLLQKMARLGVAPEVLDGAIRMDAKVAAVVEKQIADNTVVQRQDFANIRKAYAADTDTKRSAEKKRHIASMSRDFGKVRLTRFMEKLRDIVGRLEQLHHEHEETPRLLAGIADVQDMATHCLVEFGHHFDREKVEDDVERLRREEQGFDQDDDQRFDGIPVLAQRESELNPRTRHDTRMAEAYIALSRVAAGDLCRWQECETHWDSFVEGSLIEMLAWLCEYDLTAYHAAYDEWSDAMDRWRSPDRYADETQIESVSAKPVKPRKPRRAVAIKEAELRPLFFEPYEPGGLTSLEICAGAGGQAIGLHHAGFHPIGIYERDSDAVQTLLRNPGLGPIFHADVRAVEFSAYRGRVDIFAGGVPCQPFSALGGRQGAQDERDLFMHAVDIVECVRPKAVMLENVDDFRKTPQANYRGAIFDRLQALGYETRLVRMNAMDFGLGQQRRRVVIVALRDGAMSRFRDPPAMSQWKTTAGDALHDLMGANGWTGVDAWRMRANTPSPCIVGAAVTGRSFASGRQYDDWEAIGTDGTEIVDHAPSSNFPAHEMPSLTLKMGARLQGFPEHWDFAGSKVQKRRQIANAFPPVMAAAMAISIREALTGESLDREHLLNGLRHRPGETPFDLDVQRQRRSLVSWLVTIGKETGLPTGIDQGQRPDGGLEEMTAWLNDAITKNRAASEVEPV